MKIFLAAALLSTVVATPVFAAESGGYIGITAGVSKMDNPFNTRVTKNNDTVGGVLVGYQYTRNWGVEVFYTTAGKMEDATGISLKGDALGINAVGTAPISDTFSLYAKLGYASTKADISVGTGDRRGSVTGGVGGQYNISKDVGIRLGWDGYGFTVNNGAQKPASNVLSMGVVFKF